MTEKNHIEFDMVALRHRHWAGAAGLATVRHGPGVSTWPAVTETTMGPTRHLPAPRRIRPVLARWAGRAMLALAACLDVYKRQSQ